MKNSKHKKSVLLVTASCATIILMASQSVALPETPKEVTSETKRKYSISSEAELAKVVAQLDDPATRLSAISTLAQFSSFKLYQVGSVFFSSGNRDIDALRQQAVEEIRKHTDFETVSQALDSPDRNLQFWSVWFWRGGAFKDRESEPNVWLSLIPKVKNLAINGDESIRLIAVEGLQSYGGNNAFLEERAKAETSPSVLLRLLYNGYGVSFSERFNPVLLRLLNHQDKDVRSQSLLFIGSNHYHAEMWQIKFDKSIVDKVIELTKSESEEERKAALFALAGMKEKPRRD